MVIFVHFCHSHSSFCGIAIRVNIVCSDAVRSTDCANGFSTGKRCGAPGGPNPVTAGPFERNLLPWRSDSGWREKQSGHRLGEPARSSSRSEYGHYSSRIERRTNFRGGDGERRPALLQPPAAEPGSEYRVLKRRATIRGLSMRLRAPHLMSPTHAFLLIVPRCYSVWAGLTRPVRISSGH